MPITHPSHWWAWAIRGVAAILFGILTFAIPSITLGILVLLFGIWALIDGISHLSIAFRSGPRGRGIQLLEGLLGIVVGIWAFVAPLSTGIALIYLIAAWSIITGVTRIVLAIRLHGSPSREWLIGFSGAFAIFFGIVIAFAPIVGAIAIALWVGIYAILLGVFFLWLAFRMRSRPLAVIQAV